MIKSPFDISGRDVNATLLDTNYILLVPPSFIVKVKKGNRRAGREFGYEVKDRGDGVVALRTVNADDNGVCYLLKSRVDISKKIGVGYGRFRICIRA